MLSQIEKGGQNEAVNIIERGSAAVLRVLMCLPQGFEVFPGNLEIVQGYIGYGMRQQGEGADLGVAAFQTVFCRSGGFLIPRF